MVRIIPYNYPTVIYLLTKMETEHHAQAIMFHTNCVTKICYIKLVFNIIKCTGSWNFLWDNALGLYYDINVFTYHQLFHHNLPHYSSRYSNILSKSPYYCLNLVSLLCFSFGRHRPCTLLCYKTEMEHENGLSHV